MTRKIPNLIIIGSQKSGTTSLHEALDIHPEIHMSSPMKEPTYFFPDAELIKRLKRYKIADINTKGELLQRRMGKGYAGQLFFGESSTDYTINETSRRFSIPQRMKAEVPDMRLIYIVRNPFDRIISAYEHISRARDIGTLEQAMLETAPNFAHILNTSLYNFQISAYLDVFDRKQVLILRFEDFVENQNTVLNTAFAFLGLEPIEASTPVHANAAPAKVSKQRPKFSRLTLERFHSRVLEDMKDFRSTTGFDTTRWDLDFNSWCEA